MAFKKLIPEKKKSKNSGEKFIREICKRAPAGSLLSGNNGPFPFASPAEPNNKIWTASVPGVSTNEELGERLIELYNQYAEEYDLDANILAAQAYVESAYKIWIYNSNKRELDRSSTASGLVQFTMQTIFGAIISNNISGVKPFTQEEKDRLTEGVKEPNDSNSYKAKDPNNLIAKGNRAILHQNFIDNLDLMVKAQARYMRYIANKCDDLASSTLFGYSRGPAYAATTYSKSIQNLIEGRGLSKNGVVDFNDPYLKEGLNYVIRVFGLLGDPDNRIVGDGKNNFNKNYKPKGLSFGFEGNTYNGAPTQKTLFNLSEEFNEFNANVSEADDFGILEENVESYAPNPDKPNEKIPLSIITQDTFNYKTLFFPEKEYRSGPENRLNNKNQLVLHHTVSGPSVAGDVYSWRQKGDRIGVAFIVTRNGNIYQLFNSHFWAVHLFFDDSPIIKLNSEFDANIKNISKYRQDLEKFSVGIEIDSWGGLKQKSGGGWTNYDGTVDVNNVQLYTSGDFPGKKAGIEGFRGFLAFEKYTQAQIDATRALIISLQERWGFPLEYNSDMWDYSENAMKNTPGIWTHVSFRDDKSDCHPQPELIEMLQNLT
jgi:hypothetical protein